jgi:hypothetical protein
MTEQSKTKQEPLPHLPVKSDTAWKTNREMKFDPKAKSLDDQKYDVKFTRKSSFLKVFL